jgi:23S rRNA pseudouridine2605 synthase
LISEQLQTVRAERWRQKSNPILTLEDAAEWLNTTGLCLFLPRRNQFLAPAPSFVEATTGAPGETPSAPAIENASGLMIRLIEDGAIVPLNLFGTLSEQPDFLVTREAFPYVFSLRGGRSWKVVPAKASPLVAEIWKTLEKEGSLETTEIQASLGREVTEAAVLRGLMELWSALRVMPVYAVNQPTRWELTQARFSDSLNDANKIAQTTALSALVSLYLESVLAATPDEVETFLSPLTSRSKVREVVNGLAATRQVSMIPVGTQTMFHVAGSLPEFAEPEPAAAPSEPRPRFKREPGKFEGARPSRDARGPERRPSAGRDRGGDRPRTGPPRERFAAGGGDRPRPRSTGGAGRSGGSERPLRRGTDSRGNYPARRKQFGAAAGDSPRPRTGSPRTGGSDRPYRKPEDSEQRPRTYTRKPEGGERKPFTKRPFDKAAKPYGTRSAGGDRPPRRESSPRTSERTSSGELRPGTGRPGFRPGGGKFAPRKFGSGGGNFPPKKFGSSSPRPPARPWKGADGESPRPSRPAGDAGDRPFRPRREEGSDRPRAPRSFDRPSGGSRTDRPARGGEQRSSRPFTPGRSGPGGGRSFGGRPSSGGRASSTGRPREEGKRPFFRDKTPKSSEGESKPRSFRPRPEGSGERSSTPRSSGGWKPKSSGAGGGFSKSGKPAFGKPKPGGARSGGSKFGGPKPGGSKFGGKKFGSSKPGFKSGPKPGGARPPFKKRKDEGKRDGGKKSSE